jgi:Mrp family chromosome partitioning ATPase
MSRIFDALKKVQSTRPPGPGPAAVPAPAELTPPYAAPLRSAQLSGGIAAGRVLPSLLPLPALALSDEVVREMAALRLNVESALGSATLPRTVSVTTSQPGEGSSTIAAQFASSLARDAQNRVLLVDAHVRRPAFSPERLVSAAASRTTPPSIMPVQVLPLATSVTGSLSPLTLREAIEALGAGFDWVVIDVPPILESPEGAALASVADGTVLVVHAGRTKRPVLARSADMLRKAGARVLGTVLNRRRLEIPDFIYRRI